MLSDYGATVLRVLRPSAIPGVVPENVFSFIPEVKDSIPLDLKRSDALKLLISVLDHADVLIDPYRPGVLEAMGLAPDELMKRNPRLIIARLTGFRRDDAYSKMAGHDINFLALSGTFSQLGRSDMPPQFPANLLGDFAGGGMMCAFGVLAALLHRSSTGKGQIVENNMVDGVAYLSTFIRMTRKTPLWDRPRGTNLLDGGAPWYEIYECKDDGGYMAVGALEPKFFQELSKGLQLHPSWLQRRNDRSNWAELREVLRERFLQKTRDQWQHIFHGTDACCTPVLTQEELEAMNYEQKIPVHLSASPGKKPQMSIRTGGKLEKLENAGETILNDWLGWKKGLHYTDSPNGLLKRSVAKL